MVQHRTLTAVTPSGVGMTRTRGVVFVHSAPRALAPHVEWALGAALGTVVHLDWTSQPVSPGHVRAEVCWSGRPGTGARIISALRTWERLRVEVTEEPSEHHEGERFSLTPSLGIHRAQIGRNGDVQISEERLRGALERAGHAVGPLREELGLLLGAPWDAELEPFRCAGEGTPVRWLHQTG
jgi:hypothetical protein